jgi:predicted enzyme related to lactoylglutathione lyase
MGGMQMGRVIHFEIHAEKPERAIEFYQDLFDWKFSKWQGPQDYWLIKTGPDHAPGIDGGLVKRQGEIDGKAVIAYVCTLDVNSVDEMTSRIESRGGLVVMPKMAVPGVGWLAYCKDPEGNIFGIMENNPEAA